jgi:hypothetical protein
MDEATARKFEPLPPIPEPPEAYTHIYLGLRQANSLLGGGIAIIASVLIAVFLPGVDIALWKAAVGFVVMAWLVLGLLWAVTESVKSAKEVHQCASVERKRFENEATEREKDRQERSKPVVEAVVKPYSPYKSSVCVFIVRWPSLSVLPMGAYVTISHAEATHERPLGGGLVRPPQQDGKSVVTLDTIHDDAQPIIQGLLDGGTSEDAVKRIRIGPGFDLQKLPHFASGPMSPGALSQPALASGTPGSGGAP